MKVFFVAFLLGALFSGKVAPQQTEMPPPDIETIEHISNLLQQALQETNLDEQVRIYTEVLKLDPNNQNAFEGIREAKAKIENGQKEQEKREKEDEKRAAESQAIGQAVQDGETAARSGDLDGAKAALDTATKLNATSPGVARLDGIVRDLTNYKRHVKYSLAAIAAIVAVAAVTFAFVFMGQRLPYLEVVDNPDAGTRYRLEKDVTLIGSVAKYDLGENDIVVGDEQALISPCQCEIHKQNGRYYLFDCNSRGGTQVDRERVPPEKPVALRNGSQIELATARTLRFILVKKKT